MATNTNTDADKSCKCAKSNCLKLQCNCFYAGLYCAEACGCKECFNLPDHEDKVQDARESTKKRNPLAFSPKEGGGKHRKGCCKCKKTKCLKLNCDCFVSGLYCAEACCCEECSNLHDYEDKVQEARELIKKINPLAFPPKIHSLEGVDRLMPTVEKDKKVCNCKKTKCLQLKCDCFHAGLYCGEACWCYECFNLPKYQDTVQEAREWTKKRNPLAFSPKINSLEGVEKHRKGCDCRKSMCMHVCRCYKAKVGCWDHCRCEGCKNLYGMKGGNGDIMGTSRRESDMDPLGQLEFVNKFMPQDINAGHMESVMNLPYSPSLGESSNSDMIIGTSTRDSEMAHVDQLEFMNQCTTQDMNATHPSSVINLPYNPSQAGSLNSEMMVGTSTWDYDLDLPTVEQLEFMNLFTHQDFNAKDDGMKK